MNQDLTQFFELYYEPQMMKRLKIILIKVFAIDLNVHVKEL